MEIPRSTLAQWIGICEVRLQPLIDVLCEILLTKPILRADETPMLMLLALGKKKIHRTYLWTYATTPYTELKAVIYNFALGRVLLGDWQGRLVCDDYSGQFYQVELKAQPLTAVGRCNSATQLPPTPDALHRRMLAHREKVPNGSATAKALDYSLKRWRR